MHRQARWRDVCCPASHKRKLGDANISEVNIVIGAANAWAHAMEVMAEAEENEQPAGDEVDLFEAAETVLYAAIVQWRRANLRFRTE